SSSFVLNSASDQPRPSVRFCENIQVSISFSMSVSTGKEIMFIFREQPIHNAIPFYSHPDSQKIR
ncbi:hypothetical protein ACQP3D_28545, partial [Escherichia coli]